MTMRRFPVKTPYLIDEDEAVRFLLINGLIRESIPCKNCTSRCTFNENTRIYRCTACRRRYSLFSTCKLKSKKLTVDEVLLTIYYFVNDSRINRTNIYVGTAREAVIGINKLVHDYLIGKYLDNNLKIGGPGVVIQVDEAAFKRGKLIVDPTHTLDEPDILWIVGGIESRGGEEKIFIEITSRRTIEDFTRIFTDRVLPETTIWHDGYPSYNPTCNNMGYEHREVNHSREYVTRDGVHTNLIENLWSHMRQAWRARGGVRRDKLRIFLAEFMFMKCDVDNESVQSIYDNWFELIQHVFTQE